jgi:hypothetical protein
MWQHLKLLFVQTVTFFALKKVTEMPLYAATDILLC